MNAANWLIVLKHCKGYKTRWLVILHCAVVFSCALSANAQQLAGTWIGVHTEWDLDDYCPLPTYLKLDANGSYTLGIVDRLASPATAQTTYL